MPAVSCCAGGALRRRIAATLARIRLASAEAQICRLPLSICTHQRCQHHSHCQLQALKREQLSKSSCQQAERSWAARPGRAAGAQPAATMSGLRCAQQGALSVQPGGSPSCEAGHRRNSQASATAPRPSTRSDHALCWARGLFAPRSSGLGPRASLLLARAMALTRANQVR